MRKLRRLFDEQGQSAWIDDLKRSWLRGGYLSRLIDAGITGVTANPTTFDHAVTGDGEYDDQITALAKTHSPDQLYWELATHDVAWALELFQPVYAESAAVDGYVSLELAPDIADDTAASVTAANALYERIGWPNLYVKVPATAAGVDAIHELVAAGRNVNVTLIFGLERYAAVHEAYLSGLEACDGDLSHITGVASFFVSRVDTEVDRRLDAIGTPEALALRGKAAVAQAQVAYEMFRREVSSPRWDKLAERGAHVQRPLWASTGVKNESYPDLLYVENLIGPDTVSTMPEKTIAAFLDHGRIGRTVDHDVANAHEAISQLAAVGIDMEDVALTLERQGVEKFQDSYDHLLKAIDEKAHALA